MIEYMGKDFLKYTYLSDRVPLGTLDMVTISGFSVSKQSI